MIKAVIFDLDGVIVDTARFHFLAWSRLAQELGIPFTERENERLKGVSRMQSLEILLEFGKTTLSKERKEALAERKNEWFIDYVNTLKPNDMFPGVKDLISAVRKARYKVGLASSSKNAQRVVELLRIANCFDTIVDGTMIIDTKPDPEIFLLTAQRLDVNPAACVVFEDAEAGVEAAKSAGMKCVGVGAKDQLGNADLVVTHTADFKLDQLKNW